jgi:2-polyprenyl-3-methyl-5-hydroxy-6-metoxy-1,4-benzoquinol methylase
VPTAWQQHELERISRCTVCGSERLEPLFETLQAHGWPGGLDRCAACGSGHLNPRPTPEAIGKAYLGDYAPYVRQSARPAPGGTRGRVRRTLEDAYLRGRWGYDETLDGTSGLAPLTLATPWIRRGADRLVRCARAPTRGERLLDVGCATGAYMELMRDLGWEVHGVELDEGAARTAQDAGLSVRRATMAELSPGCDGTFDHLTVGHVIEHVHDPIAALGAAFAVLRPGGRIWIGTPNLASLGFRLFRSFWRALEPPRHLVLFTPESLAGALRRTGFEDVRVVPARASARWHLEASTRLAGRHIPPRLLTLAAMMLNGVTHVKPALSDELTVVATRPGRFNTGSSVRRSSLHFS